MNPNCILAVNSARQSRGAKPMTEGQIRAIDEKMSATMRRLARTDPDWRALSADQRVLKASKQIMDDIEAEAARKVANAQRQALKTAEVEIRITESMQRQGWTRARALVEDYARTSAYIEGIKRDSTRNLMDLIDAASSTQGAGIGRKALMTLFDAQNPQMSRDLALEVFAQGKAGTGNALAKQGAEAWLKVTEDLRQRFNNNGGDVGQLDYGYLPQAHDQTRVRAAGADTWSAEVLGMLDRKRYLNEDGSQMTDAQVIAVLRGAWETISSDGANKSTPGQMTGKGAKANQRGESREIHFKDGDAYLSYLAKFGQGSMYDAMIGHIGGLTRDIGLMERYGPNPEAQQRLQFDLYERKDGPRESFAGQVAEDFAGPEAQWAVLSGASGSAQYARLAQIGQNIRNIETFGKLQGAVLSSITDLGTHFVTTNYNRLPYWQALKDVARATTGDAKDFLNAHGMIAESMISDLNRWSGEHIANNWSGRIANATMRLSLMNAWTDTLRRAFSLTMMRGTSKLIGTDWNALSQWDRYRMERHGITAEDWAVLQKAPLEQWKGDSFVTPGGIYAIEDADVVAASPAGAMRITAEIKAQTADLSARNAQDQAWIRGRIDKFDDARDALNRRVKSRQASRLKNNEKATEPLLQRMALLDAQREAAQLQADMESDFNRFATQDEIRAFINAVEDGASADKTDRGPVRRELRRGLQAAETAGRRYGEAKGRLERRMVEIENRIAEMDRDASRSTDADAKEAQKKADAMAKELADFIKASKERQQRRQAVIERLTKDEAPRIAEEAQRVRQEIAAKYIGMITDESEIAILNPDLTTRAITSGGGAQRGTAGGELARAVSQFKSFPIAMISRHWRRALDTPQGMEGAPMTANRLAYAGALMVSLTVLGAAAFQIKQLVSGKDPVDMTTGKFWGRAVAQGGGLGFVGDMLLQDTSDDRSPLDTFGRSFLGPTFGTAADAYELTKGNIDEYLAGKKTNAGAEAVRFGRSHAPLVNLWYAKAALDHAALYSLQENLSPGYLSRIESKAKKDWGQSYYWAPDEGLPSRAPDLTAVAP